ncbi:MAG: hypothetical protein GX760_03075 [Erysipelothrix sp.]|nr:hypothetical protein [Erysipelothrix sp.]
MIDLHIHSKLSSGELTVDEIFEKAKKLEVFSIVDNDHCLAYENIDLVKHDNLVSGVVFTTVIDGLLIDIIGYEVNPKIINNFYYAHYTKEAVEKNEYKLYDQLQKVMHKNNIVLGDDLQLTLVEKGISKKLVYFNAKKNNPDFPFLNYNNFYRNGLSNPFSDYFIDESESLIPLKDIVNLIKEAGGLVFLAHPYEYGVNVDDLIQKLIPLGLDGLEVFHTKAAIYQSLKLLDIAEHYNLYASAGSDFTKARYYYPIGINLHFNTLNTAPFRWLSKYRGHTENEDIE